MRLPDGTRYAQSLRTSRLQRSHPKAEGVAQWDRVLVGQMACAEGWLHTGYSWNRTVQRQLNWTRFHSTKSK